MPVLLSTVLQIHPHPLFLAQSSQLFGDGRKGAPRALPTGRGPRGPHLDRCQQDYPPIPATAQKEENAVTLQGNFLFAVQGRRIITQGKILYRVWGDGRLEITQESQVAEDLPYWLPRYGYLLKLKRGNGSPEYFGYGPAECYEDKCSHALLGRYTYTCDDPYGAYEMPQENGSHCYTRWLIVPSGKERLHIKGDSFSFCVSNSVNITLAGHILCSDEMEFF